MPDFISYTVNGFGGLVDFSGYRTVFCARVHKILAVYQGNWPGLFFWSVSKSLGPLPNSIVSVTSEVFAQRGCLRYRGFDDTFLMLLQ